MINLTPHHLIKYLCIIIIVTIILYMIPTDKLELSRIILIALAAAAFAFILDLLFSYQGYEFMDLDSANMDSVNMEAVNMELESEMMNVPISQAMPYDPYNIFDMDRTGQPVPYSYITQEQDADAYYSETGLAGYYLANNGEFVDSENNMDYANVSTVLAENQ